MPSLSAVRFRAEATAIPTEPQDGQGPYRELADVPDYSEPKPINWVPFKRFVASSVIVSAIEAGVYLFTLLMAVLPPRQEHPLQAAAWALLGLNVLAAVIFGVVSAIRWSVKTLEETEES